MAPWFIFSLLSIFALASAELTQQKILNNKKTGFDERTSAVLTFLVQAIITIPIILATDLKYKFFTPFAPDIWPYTFLVSIVASISMVFYLRSFKVKNISISTMFVAASVIVTTLLGVIFYNESFHFYKLLGIFLVLSAIVSLNFKNFQIEKNHYFGLIAAVLFGVTYTIDKHIVQSVDTLIYVFWAFTLVSVFGFIFGAKTVIKAVSSAKLNDYKPIVFSGLGYFAYNFFTFTAYKTGGEVGRVDAINNSQIFLIILAEYFILKQKDGLYRKLITAAIAFAGVFILGVF